MRCLLIYLSMYVCVSPDFVLLFIQTQITIYVSVLISWFWMEVMEQHNKYLPQTFTEDDNGFKWSTERKSGQKVKKIEFLMAHWDYLSARKRNWKHLFFQEVNHSIEMNAKKMVLKFEWKWIKLCPHPASRKVSSLK